MSNNKDGMAKNLEVVQQQLRDYIVEFNEVIVPGIKNAEGVAETIHKLCAIIEEWYDKQPRLNYYLFVLRWLVMWPAIAVFLIMLHSPDAAADPTRVSVEDRDYFDQECVGTDFGPPRNEADRECIRLYQELCPPVDFSPAYPTCDDVRLNAICNEVDFSPTPWWCPQ